MGIIMGNGIIEQLGYWTALIFTLQTEFAEKVEWGGEIVNGHSLGRHTSTQMGSGCLSCGIGKAAYMSNLQIALSEKNFEPVQDLALAATSPDYRAKKLNNTFFYYGGPEQIESGGANLMLNHIFMYLGFLLFLLVQIIYLFVSCKTCNLWFGLFLLYFIAFNINKHEIQNKSNSLKKINATVASH